MGMNFYFYFFLCQACGSGRNLSVWSLPACECILTINMHSLTQDVLFDDNQVSFNSMPCLVFMLNRNLLNLF